jgi:hypothetical protein
MKRGRRKKVEGKPYDLPLTVSREELQGILDLIAKRFRETGVERTKQDLVREAITMLLNQEGLLPAISVSEDSRSAKKSDVVSIGKQKVRDGAG